VDPAFQRALVATSYLIGVRDESFDDWPLCAEARSLVRALASRERETRAVVLAREAARIATALEKGTLR
jgi:hypothetical protein